MGTRDPYLLLGVAVDADIDAIRRAYRAQAFSCHPDIYPDDPQATERFLALGEAFGLLADPDRRAAYDRLRRAESLVPGGYRAPEPKPAGDHAFFVVAPDPWPRRGADITWNLNIPFAVARDGGVLSFKGAPAVACAQCRGSGLRLGACWVCGGRGSIRQPSGPLLLSRACPACAGRGLDHTPCPACLGRGRIPGPRPARVVIAPGTATGDRLVAQGAGEPGLGGAEAGDLLLVARVLDPDVVV